MRSGVEGLDDNPERTLRDGVLVTPIRVRVSPLPERRNLDNLAGRALMLGVQSTEGVQDGH